MSVSEYLTGGQVRERFGNASRNWIHRRLKDNSGFPRPISLGGRYRYWRLADLIEWEAAMIKRGYHAPQVPKRKEKPKRRAA